MIEKKAVVNLDLLKPRDYQLPVFEAMDSGCKRLVLVTHRRWGKDLISINVLLREALKRRGTYFYILPTYAQAKKIVWKGMTKDGIPFLDYIPKNLRKKVNQQDMSIDLINGSIIQLVGSNRYDALRGTNAVGIVFSEFAYQHPDVYPTMRPMVLENGGWLLFQSTPFGENHFYDIYNVARNSDEWFSMKSTVDDTGVITKEMIQKEIDENIISPDMVQQEYYADFSVGAQGAYYASYINNLILKEQIGIVEWEPGHKVHTAFDLGMNDATVILFFQLIGRKIHIIDVYANTNVGMEHYIQYVLSKPYIYGTHIAPHDIGVRDYSAGGETRWDKAKDLGIQFRIAPKLTIMDGIETVRSNFSRLWIDERNCKKLISALRDYRKEYDDKLKRYKDKPLHDLNSDYADSLRYLMISLHLIGESMSEEEAEQIHTAAMYGNKSGAPSVFDDVRYR